MKRASKAHSSSPESSAVDANDIADEIARDWDAGDRGKLSWVAGESKPEASEIAPHIEAW